MADWVDIGKLLEAYRGDLTKRATQFRSLYSQGSGLAQSAINSGGSLATPINWNNFTDQANSSVPNRGGPSVISRIFDVLSRPGYAVSEGVRQGILDEPGDSNRVDDVLSGIWQGFSGKKKTHFSRVFDELEYQNDKRNLDNATGNAGLADTILQQSRFSDILQNPNFDPTAYKENDKGEGSAFNAISGFGADVLTDPLNLLGGAIFKGTGKAVGTGVKGYKKLKGLEDLELPAEVGYVSPLARTSNQANLPPVPNSAYVSDTVNPVAEAFSTSYKNSALRPSVMTTQQTARARATSRATALNAIAKRFGNVDINTAFRISQGRRNATGNVDIDKLGTDFEKAINDLFFESDMNKYANLAHNGIKGNKQGLIDDVNEQLRIQGEKFQFATKVTDEFRNNAKVDLSGGNQWMQGWRYSKMQDPLVFMSKLSHAVENVTAKYQFLDDFAERFGKTTSQAGRTKLANGKMSMEYTAGIRNARLKGRYFDPQIAREMNHVLKNWDLVSNPKSPFIKLLDEATSLWKTGVTIYAPSHHIRNMIGDMYFSWMAGVKSPTPYRIAGAVLRSQAGRYKDIAEVSALTGKRSLNQAMANPSRVAMTTRGGIPLTHEAIYTAAYNRGLLQSASVIEDVADRMIDLRNLSNPIAKKVANPFGGKVAEKVKAGTELREHYAKLAHFVDALKKTKTSNFEDAVTEAARQVRKWHPDGMDLTKFERNYMRRLIPFYSWTRKSIPLIVESTVRNPGKALMYPRLQQMVQGTQGINSPSISDPFPEDQLFPDWIKEKGIGPISMHGDDSGIGGVINAIARSGTGNFGGDSGYNIVNPSNPLLDFGAQFLGMGKVQDPVSGIASSANPLFRIPAELATGHTTLGVPTEHDPAGYVAQQIPFLNYIANFTNVTPFGMTARGEKEGPGNMEALINFLTALGIKGTGPYTKQAEFEAKERAKSGG